MYTFEIACLPCRADKTSHVSIIVLLRAVADTYLKYWEREFNFGILLQQIFLSVLA